MAGKDNLKSWEKGQSGNPDGRPKKIYTILKDHGYSKDDIRTVFSELPWYTMAQLQEVHTDESKPIITRIVANQLYLALKQGDFNKVKEILEHSIGKATQSVEVTDTTSTRVIGPDME